MRKSLYSRLQKQLTQELGEARRAAGLTQTEVAAALGRPQSFVAKYEGGERRLDVIEFLEIAKVLGADPVAIVKRLTV